MSRDDRDKTLQAFANAHYLSLVPKGTCGLERPCVGFIRGTSYVAFHPYNLRTVEPISGFDHDDERLYAPDDVNAYSKHNSLCVLVGAAENYELALDQLCKWVEHLEAQGAVEVVEYLNGAVGMQAMLSGSTGHAIRFKEKAAT